MKYIGILRQDGGCDYTIGCGINTVQFDAANVKEAATKLKEIVHENYSHEERRLKSVQFFEIANIYEVDVNLWYAKLDDQKKAAQLKEENERDWAEFQRLKQKFGS